MGYRIDYGPEGKWTKANESGNVRIRAMTACFLLLFAIAVRVISPAGTEKLREIFLPGEVEASGKALSVMLERLGDGATVGESVMAFCRSVIAEGTPLED